MKILSPFDMIKEVKPLIEAGAEELYCGVNSEKWQSKGVFSNARQMFYGNLNSFNDLAEAIAIAGESSIPVYLCANGNMTKGPYKQLEEDIAVAIDTGISGIIVADITLIPLIKKMKEDCKVILSCLNPCLCREGVDFYHDLGVDRIILTLNQLTLEEIEDISRHAGSTGMETEIFVNNISCRNMPGNCLYNSMDIFLQRYKTGMKSVLKLLKTITAGLPFDLKSRLGKSLYSSGLHPKPCRTVSSIEVEGDMPGRIVRYSPDKEFTEGFCRLCSIFLLDKYGVDSGKIAGRGYPTARKIKDTAFAAQFMQKIKNNGTGEENYVLKGMSVFREIYGGDCMDMKCHYSEISEKRDISVRSG